MMNGSGGGGGGGRNWGKGKGQREHGKLGFILQRASHARQSENEREKFQYRAVHTYSYFHAKTAVFEQKAEMWATKMNAF